MLQFLKDNIFTFIELSLYALAHMYDNIYGEIFYLLFCAGMLFLAFLGVYRIYKKNNNQLLIKEHIGFYLLVLCFIIYGSHGIIISSIDILKAC